MKQLLFVGFLIVAGNVVFAQTDADGCKDHPMFNRMPNTYISECSKNYNEIEFQTSADTWIKKEGMKTYINYVYDSEKRGIPPSFFQIVINYENAIKKHGGKKVYYESGQPATLSIITPASETWIILEDYTSTNGDGNYGINIIEVEAMQQDIQASAMFDELNSSGHIALYINFATGKSDIKPESMKIIGQIVEMMKTNPELKVSIEGHTDNTGTPASNMTLSSSRAAAVVAAIVAQGIEKERLISKGLGQTKPIADNSTEEGKAKNRRVEIVKQ